MKKIAVAVMLASGLIAAENGFYMGVDIGNTEYNFKASAFGISAENEDDGGSQTFKAGYFIDKNNRASAFYQNVNVDNGDGEMYGVGYDYLIGNNAFKPFVGALLGYGSSESDDGIIDLSGSVYGAQAGVNYTFNENFSVEAGYRYLISDMDDTVRVSGVDVKVEIDTVKNWFIGANYKF